MTTPVEFEDLSVAGGLIFARGLAPASATSTIADETLACVRALERALREAGCTLQDLAKVNCFLSEDDFRTEFWATWDETLGPLGIKAVRITQVAGIGGGSRVALDAIAVRP